MRIYGYKPILLKKMKVLFLGINPCVNCVKNGYFSNNKSFWFQLAESGILPGVINDKQIANYGYGIMNLSDYISDNPNEVPREEWTKGCIRLTKILVNHDIDVLCSVGKFPIRNLLDRTFLDVDKVSVDEVNYGWLDMFLYKEKFYKSTIQRDLNQEKSMKVFVMMFPTHRSSKKIKLRVLAELKEYLDTNYNDVRNNFGQKKMTDFVK